MNARSLSLTLVLGLAAVGCGGGSSSDAGSDPAETAAPEAEQTAKPAPEQGIATVDYEAGATGLDGYRVRIDSLRREGPFMTLNATVMCVKPAAGDDDCYSQGDFTGEPGDNNVFSGVVVVDTSGQRAYTVVRRDVDEYTAALEPSMAPDAPARHVWARYAAPPGDVRSVDLILPQGGPRIPDVGITDGGGVDTEPPATGEQAATPAEFDRPPESPDASGLEMGDFDITAETTSERRSTKDRRGRRVVTLAADVLFDFDEASLGSGGQASLEQVAADIEESASTGPIAIDGYTDSKGSDAYNRDLSERRARTVRDGLSGKLGDRELRAQGRGEADPVAPNARRGEDNPAGRRKNRRVTVGYTLARADAEPAASATPAPTSEPAQAVQTQPWSYVGSGSGDRSDLDVTPVGVRRAGNLSVLDVDVTCKTSEEEDCDQQFILSRVADSGNYAGGITLTDPAQDATYGAAIYDERIDVTTLTRFAPGAKRRITVYFGAIPASTTTVTVQIPNGGPRFAGVPVV